MIVTNIFSHLGSTTLSSETFSGQSNSEEELNQSLDNLLDLARLFQLQNLRKRSVHHVTFFF